jgi:hypothetical protein
MTSPGRIVLVALAIAGAMLQGCTLSAQTFCQPDPGGIVFGLERDEGPPRVSGCAGEFPPSTEIAFLGVFAGPVSGTVVLELTKNGGAPSRAGGFVFSSPGDYLSGKLQPTDVQGPGHYVVRMLLDLDVLASGDFDIVGQ